MLGHFIILLCYIYIGVFMLLVIHIILYIIVYVCKGIIRYYIHISVCYIIISCYIYVNLCNIIIAHHMYISLYYIIIPCYIYIYIVYSVALGQLAASVIERLADEVTRHRLKWPVNREEFIFASKTKYIHHNSK